MTVTTADLRERLLEVMDRKDHWAWNHFEEGRASRDQLLIHYQQEYEVYVRDFPIFLSRLHARCPHPEVRQDLAENLFEEETGKLSTGKPHPELFLHMMDGLGLDRDRFAAIRLLPGAVTYRRWIDRVTESDHWLEGVALVTLFIEGSVHERRYVEGTGDREPDPDAAIRGSWLVRHYGVDPRFLELKRAHQMVESGHREMAWNMVLEHARDGTDAARVCRVMDRALDLWMRYRDDVARTCGIPRPVRVGADA